MVTNVYDHMGRRVRKVSRGGAESAGFVYDGWSVIREVRSQGAAAVTNHFGRHIRFRQGRDASGRRPDQAALLIFTGFDEVLPEGVDGKL